MEQFEYTVIGQHGFSSTLLADGAQEAWDRVLEVYGAQCGLTTENTLVVGYGVFEDWVASGKLISELFTTIQKVQASQICHFCHRTVEHVEKCWYLGEALHICEECLDGIKHGDSNYYKEYLVLAKDSKAQWKL